MKTAKLLSGKGRKQHRGQEATEWEDVCRLHDSHGGHFQTAKGTSTARQPTHEYPLHVGCTEGPRSPGTVQKEEPKQPCSAEDWGKLSQENEVSHSSNRYVARVHLRHDVTEMTCYVGPVLSEHTQPLVNRQESIKYVPAEGHAIKYLNSPLKTVTVVKIKVSPGKGHSQEKPEQLSTSTGQSSRPRVGN